MNNTLKIVFIAAVSLVLTMTAACTKQAKKTGFLSDYSRLDAKDKSLQYINMKRLGEYSRFMIEPVVVRGTDVKLDTKTRTDLANYLHNAIVNAIKDRYMIVSQPAADVARVRVAITDIEKSSPVLNIIPQTKLTGVGLGGASMEGEVIDSMSNEQIAAVIQSQKGKRLSLAGIKKWGDAKAVMDEWAKRFRKRLDEAHGY